MRGSRGSVLVASSAWWPAPARLAMAFAREGFHVAAIHPRGHPLLHVSAVQKCYRYSPYRPLSALALAINTCEPDLVVPTDDRSAVHLHALHAGADARTTALIRRSLGAPEAFPTLASRHATLELARQLGVRVPPTLNLRSAADLDAWQQPFPWVVKSSGSWGGAGVYVVQDREMARAAFRSLARPLDAARALKRWLVNRDGFSLAPWLAGVTPEVVAQRFISGTAATIAAACWNGSVVAAMSVQALRTQGPTGAATVVRAIDAPEMVEAARRLAAALCLSGLHGLDFVLGPDGRSWLIEVNPRATQICHIAREGGMSLAACLGAQLTGDRIPTESPVPRDTTIALFPQAWRGEPLQPLLATEAHDVPWEEPALVEDLMAPPWPNRSWLARAWERTTRPDAVHPWAGAAVHGGRAGAGEGVRWAQGKTVSSQ